MEDILKIVKSLEVFGILLKRVSGTIKDAAKEERGGFLSMLLVHLVRKKFESTPPINKL